MDSQQVEIVGRSLLTALLVADGIEVAAPLRVKPMPDVAERRVEGLPLARGEPSSEIEKLWMRTPDMAAPWVGWWWSVSLVDLA